MVTDGSTQRGTRECLSGQNQDEVIKNLVSVSDQEIVIFFLPFLIDLPRILFTVK